MSVGKGADGVDSDPAVDDEHKEERLAPLAAMCQALTGRLLAQDDRAVPEAAESGGSIDEQPAPEPPDHDDTAGWRSDAVSGAGSGLPDGERFADYRPDHEALPDIPAFLRLDPLKVDGADDGGWSARQRRRGMRAPIWLVASLVFVASAAVAGATYVTDFGFMADLVDRSPHPRLSVRNARGVEDGVIALEISVAPAFGTALAELIVEGLPEGAVLSAGRQESSGKWLLSPDSLANLTVTPAENYNGTVVLFVTATAQADEDLVESVESLTLVVEAVADAPHLRVTDVAGAEDTPVRLGIAASVTDAREQLVVTIADIPDGATMSHGEPVEGLVWSVPAGELADLSLTPPANFKGAFALRVSAMSTDGDDDVVVSRTVDVTIRPVADPAILEVAAGPAREDTPIPVRIAASPADVSETVSVGVSGLPDGAALTAGVRLDNGGWSLTAEDLVDLALVPPANFNGELSFAVTAKSFDGADQTTVRIDHVVAVTAEADRPALRISAATGPEDSAIALPVAAKSGAAGERLLVTISDVPQGAQLSAGAHDGAGAWTLTSADLADLTLTPPADFSGAIALRVVAASIDGSDRVTRSERLEVSVTPVADVPILSVTAASGHEDTEIDLPISVKAADASETVEVRIEALPPGATLSAGSADDAGVWTVPLAALPKLSMTPPANFSGSLSLPVVAVATDSTDRAETRAALNIVMAPVADPPQLAASDVFGLEDEPAALEISVRAVDEPELLSLWVEGLPEGGTLSAGTRTEEGRWAVPIADLTDLKLTPPEHFNGAFDLVVIAVATDGDATAETRARLQVKTAAVADPPVLGLQDAAGTEDGQIPLAIDVGVLGPAETVSLLIDNLPAGASLSAGTEVEDGRWRIASEDVADLRLSPPNDFSGVLELGVVAEALDGTDRAVTHGILKVSLSAVADSPLLTIKDVSGVEDEPLPLAIAAAPGDVSEVLVIRIAGLPNGAALTSGQDEGNGRWRLSPADLAGLALIPPRNFHGVLPLAVAVTAFDGAASATAAGDLVATVRGVADRPSLAVQPASGIEDRPIPLAIEVTAEDPSERLEITLFGLPEGGSLSAGAAAESGWALATEDLAALTFTAPQNFSGSVPLEVLVVSIEGSDRAESRAALGVAVAPVADEPRLSVLTAAGAEDSEIPLTIDAAVTDPSETLAVEIGELPPGASLSAGVADDTGRWSIPVADLDGLTLTPPQDFSGILPLTVTAFAQDGADQAASQAELRVAVKPVADPPRLAVSNVFGPEDTAIPIPITSAVSDPSERLLVTIEDVPAGASLSAGSRVSDGVWSIEPEALVGLMLTPPADFSGAFSLRAGAVAVDGEDRWEKTETITVVVAPVADEPQLAVADAAGEEDRAVALIVEAAAADSSEALTVHIAGVPAGGALSAGTREEDGRWILTPVDLAGLSLTPPENFDGTLELLAVAESRDGAGVAKVEQPFGVTFSPVADAARLAVAAVEGREDLPVGLSIVAAVADPSETLSLSIESLPAGAALSAGVVDGEGRYMLTADDLVDLSLLPPKDFSGAFSLAVVAETTDGTDVAVTETTFDVTFAAVADVPVVSVADAVGEEDEDVALALAAAPGDVSEALTITVDGLPEGAILSAGAAGDGGGWEVAAAELAGLTLTPPADFSGQIPLSISVAATDGDDRLVTEHGLVLTIEPRADTPTLRVSDALGIEDGTITLDIDAALADPSEQLFVTLREVPVAAALSAGTETEPGVWVLAADDLPGLAMTLPEDFNGKMQLVAVATAVDGDDTAELSLPLGVVVAPVADAPVIAAASVQGGVGEAIPVPITVSPGAAAERVAVTVGGLPAGAALSAGEGAGNGGWTLTGADLTDLNITLPEDYEGSFTLLFGISAIDGNDRKDIEQTLEVTVPGAAGADAVLLAERDSADSDGSAVATVPGFATINTVEQSVPAHDESPPATRAVTVKPAAGPAFASSAPTLSQEELEGLTERGNALLRIGDIFSARLMFELAARSDHAAAGLGLGKTYDPVYFSDANVVGAVADPEKAKRWYGIARDQGNAEAGQRLALLRAWLGEEDQPEVIDAPPAPQRSAPPNTATARRVF